MGYKDGLQLVGNKYHYRFKHNNQVLRGSTGCSTLPDAQRWLRHYRSKINFEGVGIREMPTLKELLEGWEKVASATNQPGQIKSMRAAVCTHFKALLSLPLDQLTTDRVQAALQTYLRTKGKGPGRQGHSKVRRVGKEIGLLGLTPHRLKASFVSALVLEGNVPLPQAQKMAGHKHVQTTMRYVEGAEEHKEAVKILESLHGFDKKVPKTVKRQQLKPEQKQQERHSPAE